MEELERVARELARRGIGGGWYWREGEKVFIRTVTYHCVGKIKEVGTDFVALEPAAWVADSGRFGEALANGFGERAEVEPIVGVLVVQRAAIVDSMSWKHAVPTVAQ